MSHTHGQGFVERIADLEARNARLVLALKAARPWFGHGMHSEHRFNPEGYWPWPLIEADKLVDAAIRESEK
jgi:hypothetical protein